jgi:hypothetical protein
MTTFTRATTIVLVLAAAACGGSDPGGGASDADAGVATPSTPSGTSPSGSGSSSGTTADAGADAAPPLPNDPVVPGTHVTNPTDAFSGAPAYASNPPTIRANAQHSAPVTGKPCLSCHDGKTCTKFDFGGTIWKYPELTTGAADAEIRIIDANDMAHSVHADADGNFWHRADGDLALPALSGVRVANWQAIGTLNGVSCNQCHESGNPTPGRLFVH